MNRTQKLPKRAYLVSQDIHCIAVVPFHRSRFCRARKIPIMLPRSISARFVIASLLLSSSLHLAAQDETSRRHGRKYKAPPATSHIEVYVTKKATGKPVSNAAVIFRALRDGKDDGNLEVKTDPDGKATIDVIASGSQVQVQVIANGLATYADSYLVNEPSRENHIAMLKPQEQVSAYEDNSGKESGRKAGVQEPKPVVRPAPPASPALKPGPKPAAPETPAASPETTPKS